MDCFLDILHMDRIPVMVHNAYMEEVLTYYGRKDQCAIIEMAQAAGLPQVEGRKNPLVTTTYGVGEMIKHAVDNGCKEIVLGLGGSCTNDGGTGMALALGTRFLNEKGEEFHPVGGNLKDIYVIDNKVAKKFLNGITIQAMCDINNPLFGENGAAYIYGPQKGADAGTVEELDGQLRHLDQRIIKCLHMETAEIPGAGAAGGLGAGVVAFLGGDLKSGIETILDLVRFEELIKNTTCIITGEGQIDKQSMEGKAVIGISQRAVKKNIPVLAIVGSIGDGAEQAYQRGVTSMFSINRKAEDFSISCHKSKENLESTMDSIMRLLSLSQK